MITHWHAECWRSSDRARKLKLTFLLTHFVSFPLFLQVRSRTGARGTAATGASPVRTSWRVTTGSTRAPNPSSAPSARAPSPDPTTWPCTWRDTRTSGVFRRSYEKKKKKNTHTKKHTSTVLTHIKHLLYNNYIATSCLTQSDSHWQHSSSRRCCRVLENGTMA